MTFWEKVLWEGESPLNGKIKVVETGGYLRLVAEGYTQSRTLDEKGKTDLYWDRFRDNLPQLSDDSKALILGLGGGTIAKILKNKYPDVTIKGVEIDPVVVDLGKKYFYLDLKNLEIVVADAGKYMQNEKSKYDVICLDIFFRDKVSDLLDDQIFLQKVKNSLKNDGVVIINKICRNMVEDTQFVEEMEKVFRRKNVSRERGNTYEQNVIFYGKD